MPKGIENKQEIQIIGITINDWRFETHPARHRARVSFDYDLNGTAESGTTDCLCLSDLPGDAKEEAIRDALIDNAMNQLRRMPEIWLGQANLTLHVVTSTVKLRE